MTFTDFRAFPVHMAYEGLWRIPAPHRVTASSTRRGATHSAAWPIRAFTCVRLRRRRLWRWRWWEISFSAPLAGRYAHAPAGRAYTRYSRWLPSHSDNDADDDGGGGNDSSRNKQQRSLTRTHARTYVCVCTRNLVPFIRLRTNTRALRITRVSSARSLARTLSLSLFLPSRISSRAKEVRASQKRANARRERRRPVRTAE